MARYRLVVGLGNPGDEYAHTRHNAGFTSIDALADKLGVRYWKNHLGALVATVDYAGDTVVLAKPQSFMNTSGGPVSKVAAEQGFKPADILVVHDDLDLPAGTVRLKRGGGAGGHNGLKSITEKLGTPDFARIKLGIGRPPGRMNPADYVLAQLRGDDWDAFEQSAEEVAEVVCYTLERGLDAAMQKYHAPQG